MSAIAPAARIRSANRSWHTSPRQAGHHAKRDIRQSDRLVHSVDAADRHRNAVASAHFRDQPPRWSVSRRHHLRLFVYGGPRGRHTLLYALRARDLVLDFAVCNEAHRSTQMGRALLRLRSHFHQRLWIILLWRRELALLAVVLDRAAARVLLSRKPSIAGA